MMSSSTEKGFEDGFLRECRTGWLLVADDFGGKLNEKESLRHALQCTGRNPSQKSIDKYWSQNGGSTTFTQFCSIMRREHPPSLEDLITLFKRIDKTGDGLISANDLTRVLTKRGEPMSSSEAQAIIEGMNLNEDRKLDYTEFCQMVIETTEDCMRTARLRVQMKEQELEDRRRGRRQKGAEHDDRRSSPERREREQDKHKKMKETKKHDSTVKKNTKRKAPPSPVIYPTAGSESLEDDLSSDLPTVTPTSVDGMSPLSSIGIPETSLKSSLPPIVNNRLPPLSPDKKTKDQLHEGISRQQEQLDLTKEHSSRLDEPKPNTDQQETVVQQASNKADESTEHNSPNEPSNDTPPKVQSERGGSNSNSEDSVAEELEEEVDEDHSHTLEDGIPSNNGRLPDHLPSLDQPVPVMDGFNILSPKMSSAPKPPKDLETWNSIEGKGCFYITNTDGDTVSMQSHQYTLCLSSPSHVWIEMSATPPGDPVTDMGLYIFHMNELEQPTRLITYTQHFVNRSKWVCRLDLDKGNHLLLPYSPGCWLQRDGGEEGGADDVPLIEEREGKKVLTLKCINALEEIFHRHDLDSNGAISRNEFDFFHERTSKDVCDDDSWKIMQDNFNHNDDGEITLQGFLDLHELTANDQDGGEPELWNILHSMGYNRRLQLTQACPFSFELFTQECDGEIEILPISASSLAVDPALCSLSRERGITGTVKDGGEDVIVHVLPTSHLTTVVIENKQSKKCLVQVDCSETTNCLYSRDSAIHVLGVDPGSMEVAYHLLSKDAKVPIELKFVASLIKN